MSQEVEVSLRIPVNRKAPLLDERGYPLEASAVRFKTVITVAKIPKPGDPLALDAAGRPLPATVVRADWSEHRGMFVVACQYANRSISPEEQGALLSDDAWRMEPLL